MAETILVVDDNPEVSFIASRYLSSRGYAPLTAHDGPRAIELAAQHRPSCILLDIMMPQMSGIEVMQRLRENPVTAGIPIILITAKARQEDMLTGYKEGADYYITKPFSAAQLIYGIRLVLGQVEEGTPAPSNLGFGTPS